MPKVSIIMPALNSIKYIKECMDSVVNQTLEDIEIIPVDAGSTDGTWEIFQKYAEEDNRIKLIHSAKKSMGYQYNIGIAAATGKYIGFVETDDYIKADMFEKLYEVAEKADVDWVKADFNFFVDLLDGERIFLKESRFKTQEKEMYGKVINPKEYPELVLREVYIWPGIYKRDFIINNNIKQNETLGAAFQDSGFMVQTLFYGNRILYVDDVYYQYRRDNSGSSAYNPNGMSYIFAEFKYVKNIISRAEKNPFFEKYVNTKYFNDVGHNYGKLPDSDESRKEVHMVLEAYSEIIRKAYEEKNILIYYRDCKLSLFLEDLDKFGYYMRKQLDHECMAVRMLLNSIKQYKQIVLFGAGEIGANLCCFLKICGFYHKILCFIDNSNNKWGQEIMGRKINCAQNIIEKNRQALYIIANANNIVRESIQRQLLNSGIPESNIYLAPEIDTYMATDLIKIKRIQML